MSFVSNLRNYLYGLNLPELLVTLTVSVVRGDSERADYVKKYIREVWDDCAGCTGHENCHGCPGRDAAVTCVGCGESLDSPHRIGCALNFGNVVELEDCIDVAGWRS